MAAVEDGDSDGGLDMFDEPDGFRQPEKPFTFQDIQLRSGQEVHLRLVGHNPLWGHLLWNAGRTTADYIIEHGQGLIKDRAVLELGAGAGLPAIASALNGAKAVVVTDYPDVELIENLQFNIDHNCAGKLHNIAAKGYLWGSDPASLGASLTTGHAESQAERATQTNVFDTLILADLLFNHVCHEALLSSITLSMRKTESARSLVFFTPYRPWLLEKDLAFFDLVRDKEGKRLEVVELGKYMMDEVLFKEDRGDETLRRTVFGFEVKWKLDYIASLSL